MEDEWLQKSYSICVSILPLLVKTFICPVKKNVEVWKKRTITIRRSNKLNVSFMSSGKRESRMKETLSWQIKSVYFFLNDRVREWEKHWFCRLEYFKRKLKAKLKRGSQWLYVYCYGQLSGTVGLSNIGLSTWMGDRISMSISVNIS